MRTGGGYPGTVPHSVLWAPHPESRFGPCSLVYKKVKLRMGVSTWLVLAPSSSAIRSKQTFQQYNRTPEEIKYELPESWMYFIWQREIPTTVRGWE